MGNYLDSYRDLVVMSSYAKRDEIQKSQTGIIAGEQVTSTGKKTFLSRDEFR